MDYRHNLFAVPLRHSVFALERQIVRAKNRISDDLKHFGDHSRG